MTEQTFDQRIAALEEHLVGETAEQALADAERFLAEGDEVFARCALLRAKSIRAREQDEWEEIDDA